MGKIIDRDHDGGDIYRWQTLERFVKENNWTNGAELGVWYGETFKYLINKCKDLRLFGVDLYAPQPDNIGPQRYIPGEDGHPWKHEEYYADVKSFCDASNGRATIYRGFTNDASKLVEDESLDFVFIDADHSFRGVDGDITHWMPKVKKGGYVIGHDIHWPSVKSAVEKHFGENYHKEQDFIWYVVK